jgi:CRP-like cAMP-binding protein
MDKENQRFNLQFIKDSFIGEEINLSPGDILFNEGEKNDFVFFIESGSIKVLKNKWVIGITKAFEFVGITSCISEIDIYTFSSKAIEDSKLLKIKKIAFKNLLLENKHFSKQIIEILCERIKLTDIRTRSYIDNSPRQRVIFEIFNNITRSNNLVAYITNEELSELTGISKRAVTKIITDLTKEGLLERTDLGSILIKDEPKILTEIKP